MTYEYLYDEDYNSPILINKVDDENGNNYDFLSVLKNHYEKYKIINKSIFLVLSISNDYTQYKVRICNYVNIDDSNKSKNTFLTTYDILIDGKKETKLFLVNNKEEDLQEFISDIKHLLSIIDLNSKLNFFQIFKSKYDLLSLEINQRQSIFRINYIEKIKKEKLNDYILRDPNTDKLISPPINILFLNCTNLLDIYPTIKIKIKKENTKIKNLKYTFLSYKIPINSINFDKTSLDFKDKNSFHILLSYASIHKFKHIIKIPITYKEEILNKKRFDQGYYLQTIHFSELNKIREEFLNEIPNKIYEFNLGTIVFDLKLNPIGFIGNKDINVKRDIEKYYITFFNSEIMNYIFSSILEVDETKSDNMELNNNINFTRINNEEKRIIHINEKFNPETQVHLTLKNNQKKFYDENELQKFNNIELKFLSKKILREMNIEMTQNITFTSIKKESNNKIQEITLRQNKFENYENEEIQIKKEKFNSHNSLSDGQENINEDISIINNF